MKTSLTFTITALALTGISGQNSRADYAMSTSAAGDSSTSGTCDFSSGKFIDELLPFTQMALDCQQKTGFIFVPPTKSPSSKQTTKICANCGELIDKVQGLSYWPQCQLEIDGKKTPLKKLFEKIISNCGSGSGSGSSATAMESAGGSSAAGSAGKSTGNSASTENGSDGAATITTTILAGLAAIMAALAM